MKTNHIGIVLAWLATILLLTACGGGGSSSPSPAAPTGSVTITGTAMQWQTLVASNTLADTNGLGTISYQWKANGNDIIGATGNSYTLNVNDIGKIITVNASYTDGIGTHESVSSTATSPVALPPIYTHTYIGPNFTGSTDHLVISFSTEIALTPSTSYLSISSPGFIESSVSVTGLNGFTLPVSGGGFQIHTDISGAIDSWSIQGGKSTVTSNVGTDWQAYSINTMAFVVGSVTGNYNYMD